MEQVTALVSDGRGQRAADSVITQRAKRVLEIILQHRRLLPGELCALSPCEECFGPHLTKVVRAMLLSEPIQLVLPAFPAKSSNRMKTLGPDPDRAEEIALGLLQDICVRIGEIYRPGARLILCSDGRVFGDLVQVSDENVTRYRDGILRVVEEMGATHLSQYTLDDAFDVKGYDALREELLVQYATPLSVLREEVREGGATRHLFDGIHRFVFEDYCALFPQRSRTQHRLETKGVAYRVIQRSNAWSRAVEARFPMAVRLSIHPQAAHSSKLGISFMPSDNVWRTPWHGVVMERDGEVVLTRRSDAEGLGATLVHRNGRPSHYVMQDALLRGAAGV